MGGEGIPEGRGLGRQTRRWETLRLVHLGTAIAVTETRIKGKTGEGNGRAAMVVTEEIMVAGITVGMAETEAKLDGKLFASHTESIV